MYNSEKLQKTPKIIINNLEIMACHGVNPEEKVNKQPFSISLEIEPSNKNSEHSDDIADTISYSDIAKLVKKTVENNCFNLIERLANEILIQICKNYKVESVEIFLKKLDPPMKIKPEYVGYKKTIEFVRTYLCLGSSLGDKNAKLDFAIKSLKQNPLIRNVRESKRIITKPEGGVAKNDFLNSAVELETALTPHELLDLIHDIEAKAGRVRKVKWEDRELDIDIALFGDEIINSHDLVIPHRYLGSRLFFLKPLIELNDMLFHPVLHEYLDEIRLGMQLLYEH